MNRSQGTFAVGLLATLLVLSTRTWAAPAEDQTEALGESLVRQLWEVLVEADPETLDRWTAEAFQSVHEDGGRGREQELSLVAAAHLMAPKLTGFHTTRQDSILVVTYAAVVEETIDGEDLSPAQAPRLTVFVETPEGWKWLAHANLRTLAPPN
jgi:hypothetical protein